jgi:hypothetical protein
VSSHDTEYYRQRAVTERALARSSERRNVAEIHEELARLYEALVAQEELRAPLDLIPTRYSAQPHEN